MFLPSRLNTWRERGQWACISAILVGLITEEFLCRRIWQLLLDVTYDSVHCAPCSIWSSIIPLTRFLYFTVLRVFPPFSSRTTVASLPSAYFPSVQQHFFFSFLPQEDFSASLCIHSNFPHILKPQDSSLVSRSFLYRMDPFGSQERVIRSRFAEDPLTLKGEVSTDRPRTPPYLQAARSHFHCGLISS